MAGEKPGMVAPRQPWRGESIFSGAVAESSVGARTQTGERRGSRRMVAPRRDRDRPRLQGVRRARRATPSPADRRCWRGRFGRRRGRCRGRGRARAAASSRTQSAAMARRWAQSSLSGSASSGRSTSTANAVSSAVGFEDPLDHRREFVSLEVFDHVASGEHRTLSRSRADPIRDRIRARNRSRPGHAETAPPRGAGHDFVPDTTSRRSATPRTRSMPGSPGTGAPSWSRGYEVGRRRTIGVVAALPIIPGATTPMVRRWAAGTPRRSSGPEGRG